MRAPSLRCLVNASQNKYNFTRYSLDKMPIALLEPIHHQLFLPIFLDQHAIDRFVEDHPSDRFTVR
jgi:hypothetical protein